MPAELLPTGRDPLRRFGSTILIIAVLGVVAIVYSMVNFVRERTGGEEWILGVGFCLLMGAAAAGMVHAVLLDTRARIQALEARAAADGNRKGSLAS
jgi:hypothetical protein